MNKMRALGVGIIMLAAFTCAALVIAQQNPTRQGRAVRQRLVETSRESRMIGISVVRLINTAEANYRYRHGTYASLKALFDSGTISEAQKRSGVPGMQLAASGDVVPGWSLTLVTSAKGRSYELSVRNTGDPCMFSFFSDQRGIIYQGGVIDCSIELKPAS